MCPSRAVTALTVLTALTALTAPTALCAGVLVARAPLDYETAPEHRLLVRATDSVTGAFADAALTLRLVDVNDCAPEFDRDAYSATVSEAVEPGHLVLTVRALDADTGTCDPRPPTPDHTQCVCTLPRLTTAPLVRLAGANGEVSYTLSSAESEAAEIPFTIDASSGEVRVRVPLDREQRDRYHLVAVAQDGGRPALQSRAHVLVAVQDVNDNAPRVERGVAAATVSAEAARGVAVARVAAWDPDARDAARLRYALVGAGAAARALRLDAVSGVLTVRAAGALAGAPRSLNVSVSDGAHATFARIKLSVSAGNSAAPRFPHVVHEARALENQPPPLLLTTVRSFSAYK